MDELVAILDAHGKATGDRALKSEVHRLGLFHASVHVWFYTRAGNVLLQKRSKSKDTFPGLWDVSVAGHVTAGERVEISALREIAEEIGLQVALKNLYKVGVFKSVQEHHDQFIDCEFHHVFLCELGVGLDQLVKQDSEVAALKLMDIAAFKRVLDHPAKRKKYVPHQRAYYDHVLGQVETLLST